MTGATLVLRDSKIIKKYYAMPVQARASIWYLICSFLQKGISSITTPIFSRLLTPEEFGQFNVYSSWLSNVAVFVSLRLYYGVYAQALVKFDGERDELTSSLVGLTCTLTAAWMVIYFLFKDFFNTLCGLTTSQMLSMFLIIWTEAIFSFWAARQRVEFTYRKLVIMTLAVSVAKPLFGVLAVTIFADKVTARVWELAIVEFVAYIGLFFQQIRGGRFFSRKFWLYALGFNLPLVPHYLAQTINSSSDKIMIDKFCGPGPSGIYSLAVSVAQIMTLFNTAINQTIAPWIYQQIKNARISRIASVSYPSIVMVGCINLALIIVAPEAVWVFAPAPYYEAIWVIPPVALSVYFTHLYNLYATFEFYFEKPGFIATSTAVAAVLNVGLNWILIPRFGYLVAGYTTLLSYVVYAAAHAFFSRRITVQEVGAFPLDGKVVLLYTACFVGAAVVATLTYNAPVIRWLFIVSGLIACLVNRRRVVAFIRSLMDKRKESKT